MLPPHTLPACRRHIFVLEGHTATWTRHLISRQIARPLTDIHLCSSGPLVAVLGIVNSLAAPVTGSTSTPGAPPPPPTPTSAPAESHGLAPKEASQPLLTFFSIQQQRESCSSHAAPANLDLMLNLRQHLNNTALADITIQTEAGLR